MSTKTTIVETGIVGESEGGIGGQRNPVGCLRTSNPGEVLGNTHEREVMILGKEAYVVWHGSCKVVDKTGEEGVTERASALDVDRLGEELRETYSRFGWGGIEVRNLDI